MDEDLKQAYIRMLETEGRLADKELAERTRNSHILDMGAMVDIIKNYNKYKDLAINDKYKHAMINCQAAQRGTGGALGSSFFAGLKELYDINPKNNTIDESHEDDIANNIGRYLGFKYPYGDCDEMVRKYIRK